MTKDVVRLNLGCGNRFAAGWVNIDRSLPQWIARFLFAPSHPANRTREGFLNWDLRKGIPFPDSSVDVVYSSHVLEHIAHHAAPRFLAEMARVLRTGGSVRVVVPDLEASASRYLTALHALRGVHHNHDDASRYELATLLLLDQMVRTETGGELAKWLRANADSRSIAERGGIFQVIAASKPPLYGYPAPVSWIARKLKLLDPVRRGEMHYWMYDEVSLAEELRRAGFHDIRRATADQSRVPGWMSFNLDADPDGAVYHPGSLFMEGTK